tara:strand:- start:876 stop:1229 length:354 start_codon:yes stop_codon:yes gene_type:complete
MKKRMKNDSKKAKARYLQNLVRDRIKKLFPKLGKEDIRCSLMSENGADVKLLSLTARKLFPYSVECKRREEYKQVYTAYKQSRRHTTLEPLVVLKRSREIPLAVISLEHFFELLEDE